MNIRKWVKLALLFSAVAIMGIVVPVTLSYVFDVTAPLVNTFVPPSAPVYGEDAVEITVHKTVINKGEAAITPEGFTFLLRNSVTGETLTAMSNKEGQARFVLTFTGAQPGSYTYLLSEQNDGLEGVTYSTAEYNIRVDVTGISGRTELSLFQDDKPVDAIAAAFENIYDTEQIPDTGDHVPMVVFLVLLLGSGALLVLLVKKRKTA